jgi:hypothetical protein
VAALGFGDAGALEPAVGAVLGVVLIGAFVSERVLEHPAAATAVSVSAIRTVIVVLVMLFDALQ